MNPHAEQAVIEAGLSSGYFSPQQLDEARSVQAQRSQAGQAVDLLPILSGSLAPEQRAELIRVYNEALNAPDDTNATLLQAPTVADASAPGRPASGSTQGTQGEGAKTVGNYEVIRELGRGGMGVVYEARHRTLDRRVALKVLLAREGAQDEDVARFQLEARAAARLEHPNIVRVLEQGRAGDDWYMAMELVDGESLMERLLREGALDPFEAAEIALALSDAMAFAHKNSVLHRDLKPHNVMLDADGVPQLTDFGLAKVLGEDAKSLTLTGNVMGTPAYMSPEQASGEKGEIREGADIYSLGATLYQMLTGQAPFAGKTLANIMVRVMNDPPTPPRELNPDVPPALGTIVLKCLEKEPADRYPSMKALRADLSRFLKDLDIVATRPDASLRFKRWAGRRRGLVGVVVASAVLLGVVGGVALQQISKAEEEKRVAKLEADEKRLAAEREAKKRAADVARLEAELAERERAEAEAREKREAEAAAEAKRAEEARAQRAAEAEAAKRAAVAAAKREAEVKARHEAEIRAEQEAEERKAREAEAEAARRAEERDRQRDPAEPPTRRPEVSDGSDGDGPSPARPDVRVPPAFIPPPWIMQRVKNIEFNPKALSISSNLYEARAEARARSVPLVLLRFKSFVNALPPETQSPKLVRFLNERAVVAVAMKEHDPIGTRPNMGPRGEKVPFLGALSYCGLFRSVPCLAHIATAGQALAIENLDGRSLFRGKDPFRGYVMDPEFRIVEAVKRKLSGGTGRGAAELIEHVEKIQESMLEPAIPAKTYSALAEALAFPPPVSLSARARNKLCKTLSSALGSRAPFDAYARFRLRELCRRLLRHNPSTKVLKSLRSQFQDELGCLNMIDEALGR